MTNVSYSGDIRPKFRSVDVMCMSGRGVGLGDAEWMCDPAAAFGFADHGNARHVYERLSDGSMPPGQPWAQAWLDTYQSWITGGFQP